MLGGGTRGPTTGRLEGELAGGRESKGPHPEGLVAQGTPQILLGIAAVSSQHENCQCDGSLSQKGTWRKWALPRVFQSPNRMGTGQYPQGVGPGAPYRWAQRQRAVPAQEGEMRLQPGRELSDHPRPIPVSSCSFHTTPCGPLTATLSPSLWS